MMFNKVWNKKLSGIPGAIINVICILWEHISVKIVTCIVRANVKHHGKNVIVMRGCIYRYPQWIDFGDNVIIGKNTSMIAEKCIEYDSPGVRNGYFIVKNDVSIGNGCVIDFSGGVKICENAHLAHDVHILTHDHGYNYRNAPIGKSLEIGEGAFIGSRSIILFNCKRIGKNAVVGAGSVVTTDIPGNAIAVGNPAKVIKFIVDS